MSRPQMQSAKFLAIGAVVQQCLSFAVIILITRLIGADGYGEVVTLTAAATTIFCFSTQWALPYMVRTASISFAKTQKIGRAFFAPMGISLFFLLALTYLGTHFSLKGFGSVGTISVVMIYFAAIGQFVFQMAKTGLQIQTRFSDYGVLLSLDKVILLSILCGLLLLKSFDNAYVLWAYVAGTMLAGIGGLWRCVHKKSEWAREQFEVDDYVKSVAPVSVAVVIHYFSSIAFLILIAMETGGAQSAAWIGIGGVALGVLLQPFNWLAPTLAPKFAGDVLEPDGHVRISGYLENWVLPSCLMLLWITIGTIIFLLFTPILPLLLGDGFLGGTTVVALVASLATADASNIMLVQIVYARKLETLVMVAVILKAIPLLLGYTFGAPLEQLLILLNLGSWLAIGICLWGIRSYLQISWVMQYSALAITALLVSGIVLLPYGKWLLPAICIAITLPAIILCRRMLGTFQLERARMKVESGG